jgi:hypothetical protein
MMNARAESEESRLAISEMSAPPINEAALVGAVAPVSITARSDTSEERDSHAAVIWASSSLFTILSFVGLEIVIVPTLLPGECS